MSINKIPKVSFNKKEVSYFFQEDGGFLEPEENEKTYQISQKEICDSVDITSAAKHFELNLPHLGPYKIDYYRNGRNLLMGGRRGHVAVFDWITKELNCEFNVRESVHAVQWLHMPTMFAVAQADWTHVYDNKGIEIHCLKRLYRVYELDFLPYHFLLVAVSDNGFLSWLDISTGNLVANYRMKVPRVTTMTHNPQNAITLTGHPNGTIRMWSPNVNESLVQLLCHPAAIRDVKIDKRGHYMITTGADRTVRIWDIRNYKCLNNFKLRSIPSKLALSQKNLLAIGSGNVVNVYKDFCNQLNEPYLRHRMDSNTAIVSSLAFCPFEDVLGVGHQEGFVSLLVPGSGEPNFDAFEANPYMSRSQRREMEVKSLLEKINHELITLDPDFIAKVGQSNSSVSNKNNNKKPESSKNLIVEMTDDGMEMDQTEIPKKKTFDVTEFRPNKRGRKKIATRLKSKAAKKEKIRRNILKKSIAVQLNNKKS